MLDLVTPLDDIVQSKDALPVVLLEKLDAYIALFDTRLAVDEVVRRIRTDTSLFHMVNEYREHLETAQGHLRFIATSSGPLPGDEVRLYRENAIAQLVLAQQLANRIPSPQIVTDPTDKKKKRAFGFL
jgi:hypothetical protein